MKTDTLVLVAEDNQVILELLATALAEVGYKPVLAETGEEAVAMLDKYKVKGVITDVRLGNKRELTGWDVARHARELSPDVAVVYISGDCGVDWMAQGVSKSVMVVKPFAMSKISSALTDLLKEQH